MDEFENEDESKDTITAHIEDGNLFIYTPGAATERYKITTEKQIFSGRWREDDGHARYDPVGSNCTLSVDKRRVNIVTLIWDSDSVQLPVDDKAIRILEEFFDMNHTQEPATKRAKTSGAKRRLFVCRIRLN